MTQYWVLGINPEPWTPGTAFRRPKGAGIAKDGKLKAYQEAIKEEFVYQNPKHDQHDGCSFWFLFWRSTRHGRVADATNLQKALEDALQGVIYRNDKTNLDVRSTIIDQTPETQPAILVIANKLDLPDIIVPELSPAESTSEWAPPKEELF